MEDSLQEYKEKSNRSKKLLLWFAMISMIMVFAGLTSAYIVSKSRPDWKGYDMPTPFYISTVLIIISSITFHFAKRSIQNNSRQATTLLLWATLILGILFVIFQFKGFGELINLGLNPTGPTSTVTASYLYMFVVVHLAHLFGGLLSLLTVIYNHFKQKYNSGQTIGIELSAMFWHFLDFLWLYLFLFLYFFK